MTGPDDFTTELSSALLLMSAQLAPLLEHCSGYRAQCEQAGFSPAAAEQMAVTLHSVLLPALLSRLGK